MDRIKRDIEISGTEVSIDEKVLHPGDSLIGLFAEIGVSDFLLPVLSTNSIGSNWVKKELAVAIVKEIEEPKFKCIPIIKENEDWSKLKSEMSQDTREALRDKLFARFDVKSYKQAISDVIVALSPPQKAEEIYARIQGPKSENPFRRVRTEYFEDLDILARSFAEPESVRYDRIAEVKPTVIEGGRGSGKTMILMSLKPVVSVFRKKKKVFAESDIDYFGVYSRLSQGSFATQENNILEHLEADSATRLFETELILQLTQSLIDELQECVKSGVLSITHQQEDGLGGKILDQITAGSGSFENIDFEEAKRRIQLQLRIINEYISRKILKETLSYRGVFLRKDDLRSISSLVRRTVPEVGNTTLYFLLDEYENLLPFQKVVVNTLIKWSEAKHFTIKLATKKATLQNPQTLEGQEVEESNDYNLVDLDYDVSQPEHRALYKNLIVNVCNKILVNENFKSTDIRELLENRPPLDDNEKELVDGEVAKMYRQLSGNSFESLTEDEKRVYHNHVEVAAMVRVIKGRRIYGGTDDFALLSSGILRHFLELCGMSYYFAIQNGRDVKNGQKIIIHNQTDAAYMLSSYYLYMIRKNIADVGPLVHQFLVDVGDIFRNKLLKHLSEPEAARIAISDPQTLQRPDMRELKQLMDSAVTHSVLQSPKGIGGIRPKNATDVQPLEYLPCRIYAPVLQFSPRPRWRTLFTCEELKALIDSKKRAEIKPKLINDVTKSKRRLRGAEGTQELLPGGE